MANLSELTFILWNATSINNKEEEFDYFINNNKIDVAFVTETWLKPVELDALKELYTA